MRYSIPSKIPPKIFAGPFVCIRPAVQLNNTTPPCTAPQQRGIAARITRTGGSQGGPKAGAAGVHRPPSTMCQPFSNRTHYRAHGARITRTGGGQGGPATTAARRFPSGCDCFLPGTPGTNGKTARKSLSALRKTVPGSTGDKRKFAGDTGDKRIRRRAQAFSHAAPTKKPATAAGSRRRKWAALFRRARLPIS